MIYGSVCSGIEAASVAWHPLGWKAAFLSEIEKFPRAVLAHHYPDVPLHGDFTTIQANDYGAIDLLVGGTPCQSFSIAGLRGGLADKRGNLALEYLRLADRKKPRWLLWENVPGVLSSGNGRDFGAFLGGLVELGYGFAYRVLDAQYFGLAQRRKRVFVVAHTGNWRRAAAVLFERTSLHGNSAPRREAGERVAPKISARPSGGGGLGTDFDLDGGLVLATLTAQYEERAGQDMERDGALIAVTHALRGEGFDASEDGIGRGVPLVPVAYRTSPNCGAWETGDRIDALTTGTDPTSHIVAFTCKDHGADAGDISPTLRAMGHAGSHANAGGQVAVAFAQNQRDELRVMHVAGALAAEPGMKQQTYAIQERAVSENLKNGPQGKGYQPDIAYTLEARNKVQSVAMHAVRRLTPRECERLQGFPDDYTLIPYRNGEAADDPRYKALGNSMAVPCMAWIGRRIQQQEVSA